jgi:teichuronic acid biosynthesis glycosyltransferase TuaG
MTLSVLICVHSKTNLHDELLIKALKSLESQTMKNFETLVVLDECWSQTKETVLNSNLNLKINFLDKEFKNGLSEAKNLGLSNINTDLVAFLDGDDLYLKNKLEKQVDFFMNNKVDFLGTQSWNINGLNENNIFESCFKIGENETHEQIKNKIFFENCLTHGSMMIKMESLKQLNFYRNITGVEDWDLWKRAVEYGYKFYQIQERLYVYRLNTSVTR